MQTVAPLRIVGTHLGITELRRIDADLRHAAEQLRESEDKLRQVTDSLPTLISRWDLEQRFRFANHELGARGLGARRSTGI